MDAILCDYLEYWKMFPIIEWGLITNIIIASQLTATTMNIFFFILKERLAKWHWNNTEVHPKNTIWISTIYFSSVLIGVALIYYMIQSYLDTRTRTTAFVELKCLTTVK